jgi:uncharacterized OB-fold protein
MTDDASRGEAPVAEGTAVRVDDGSARFEALRYADGTISYPGHERGRRGGEPVEPVDLTDRTAEVVTWTVSTATPPGVREPNPLAIVEFEVDGEAVRAIGQLTTDAVSIGDRVEPVHADDLRDPDAGIREADSQSWDGFRFAPAG